MLLLYVYYFAIDDIQPILQRLDALALEIVVDIGLSVVTDGINTGCAVFILASD